jgi:hypothetical protein
MGAKRLTETCYVALLGRNCQEETKTKQVRKEEAE